jgi:hypothetical protein
MEEFSTKILLESGSKQFITQTSHSLDSFLLASVLLKKKKKFLFLREKMVRQIQDIQMQQWERKEGRKRTVLGKNSETANCLY